jgi:hypothetical protein
MIINTYRIISMIIGIFITIFILKILDIIVSGKNFTLTFLVEGDFWVKFFLAIPVTLIINYFYSKKKNK